jgi:hypothetical protein
MTDFEKRVDVAPAFENGIGCAMMHFALIGPGGAVSLQVFTGWYLPHVAERLRRETQHERYTATGKWMRCSLEGHGGAMCTHAATQIFEHAPVPDPCDLLPGSQCFGDIGFLAGETLFDVLVAEGTDALWEHMEPIYDYLVAAQAAFRKGEPG